MRKPASSPTPRAETTSPGRKPVDAPTWRLLLGALREHPGDVAHAASAAQVDVRVASRAWATGWAGHYQPIREVLLDEQVQARAQIQRETDERVRSIRIGAAMEESESLRLAQVQARKGQVQEGQVIEFARANVLLALNASTKILNALGTIGEKTAKGMVDGGVLDATLYVKLLRASAQAVNASVSAGQTVMEMERLHLGEPTKILGLAPASSRDAREALRELEETVESLRAAQLAPSSSPIPRTVVVDAEGVAVPMLPPTPGT